VGLLSIVARYSFHSVSEEFEFYRVDRWVFQHWPYIPYSGIQRAIRVGDIRVDGKKVGHDQRINTGQVIRVFEPWVQYMEKLASPRDIPLSKAWKEKIDSWVLYMDNDLVVINKPQGIASQGGSKQRVSIDMLLSRWAVENGHAESARLVHRLDKETSGVMIIALSLRSAQNLAKNFKEQTIKKVYWGILYGRLPKKTGIIESAIKGSTRPGVDISRDQGNVLPAVTEYSEKSFFRTERSSRGFSFVELRPKTGRMHQLRIHMQRLGCPIVGDDLHGEKGMLSHLPHDLQNSLKLHCFSLTFLHPVTGENLEICATLPQTFITSLRKLNLGGSISSHGQPLGT